MFKSGTKISWNSPLGGPRDHLQDFSNALGSFIDSVDKVGRDVDRAVKALRYWSYNEDEDVKASLHALDQLFSLVASPLNRLHAYLPVIRENIRSIRIEETSLRDLKHRHKSLLAKKESAEDKLTHVLGQKNFDSQREALDQLKGDIDDVVNLIGQVKRRVEEMKRRNVREWLSGVLFPEVTKWAGVAQVIARHGQGIVDEINISAVDQPMVDLKHARIQAHIHQAVQDLGVEVLFKQYPKPGFDVYPTPGSLIPEPLVVVLPSSSAPPIAQMVPVPRPPSSASSIITQPTVSANHSHSTPPPVIVHPIPTLHNPEVLHNKALPQVHQPIPVNPAQPTRHFPDLRPTVIEPPATPSKLTRSNTHPFPTTRSRTRSGDLVQTPSASSSHPDHPSPRPGTPRPRSSSMGDATRNVPTPQGTSRSTQTPRTKAVSRVVPQADAPVQKQSPTPMIESRGHVTVFSSQGPPSPLHPHRTKSGYRPPPKSDTPPHRESAQLIESTLRPSHKRTSSTRSNVSPFSSHIRRTSEDVALSNRSALSATEEFVSVDFGGPSSTSAHRSLSRRYERRSIVSGVNRLSLETR
ncbi:hypothetical protein JAAARDRAFT_196973 [Jaapia argillacea MUCL 33604]|uniref:Uncharacterized protein n=1 Tax=Jaapia argillacea MUCL 33604 TaxID=933084 RepID=A0A067PRC1_9AGAM|nr:hypothetical protein JAAARDRAFT_196973 [Jaapia argillacea MUCL 33604]